MEKIYNLDYQSNDETNEFLRCLWARLRHNFGKIAWHLHPIKITEKSYIQIGHIDLGKVSESLTPTNVSATYSKKGCLKTLLFNNNKLINEKSFLNLLNKSVEEAKEYKTFQTIAEFTTSLDQSIKFNKRVYSNFKIEGNKLDFKVKHYDKIDAKTFATSKMRFIKSILSFDTLKFINSKDSGISQIRNSSFKEISLINTDTDEVSSQHDTADEFKNLEISEEIALYLDTFLSKPINYKDPLTAFEKSILFFSEGLFFEELHLTSFSLDFNCMEYAITSYMSALELITINDIQPQKCDTCNQETFSISKRIIGLAKKANVNNDYIKKTVSSFYIKRSKFVHTGLLTSMYNYIGNSIPLMSVNSENGIINQNDYSSNNLKYIVKDLILYQMRTSQDFS